MVSAIVNVTTTLTNIVINSVVGTSEIILGTLTGNPFLLDDGNCRLSNVSSSYAAIYAGKCDSGTKYGFISNSVGGSVGSEVCSYQIPLTFYIHSFNVGFQPTTAEGVSCEDLPQIPFDETVNKVALYRFVAPSNISNQELDRWYSDIVTNGVGDGWKTLIGGTNVDGSSYHISRTDGARKTRRVCPLGYPSYGGSERASEDIGPIERKGNRPLFLFLSESGELEYFIDV